MKIKRLSIGHFSKLQNVDITLDDRVTVICGKNEAGKSTIAAFIRYMLYGFSGARASSLSDNDKKKYMPWDADFCDGEMTFETDEGKTYTAVRKNAARSQSSILDKDGMPVFGSDNAGSLFLGISDDAYKKTAFIGQADISFEDEGELDNAIHNMVFSADESMDAPEAVKRLENLRKTLLGKAKRSGKIHEIRTELESLRQEKEKWQGGHKELLASEYQLGETKSKIAFNAEKLDGLRTEALNASYMKAREKLEELEQMKAKALDSKNALEEKCREMQSGSFMPDREYASELDSALRETTSNSVRYEKAKQQSRAARDEFERVYSDKAQENLTEKLEQNGTSANDVLNTIEHLRQKKKTSLVLAVILTLLVITIPAAVFFYIKNMSLSKQLSALASSYGCDSVTSLELMLRANTSFDSTSKAARAVCRAAEENERQAKAELGECIEKLRKVMSAAFSDELPDEDNLVTAAQNYLRRLDMWLKQIEALKKIAGDDSIRYQTVKSSMNIEELEKLSALFDENIPVRDEATIKRETAFYTQANEGLSQKERELEKKAAVLSNTLPKPSEMQSRISSLSELEKELCEKCNALDMAIECLNAASESMKSEAAPKITSSTGEMFSKVTNGRYRGLFTDNEMHMSFLQGGDAQVRDALYLSAGTLDAAYICLRVTLCGFLCREKPTLVFDDAFVHMDSDRLNNMLSVLYELSEQYQILILTCHDREKRFFENKAKIINFEV